MPRGPVRWDWRVAGGPQSIPPLLCHPPGPAGEKVSEPDTGQQGWPASYLVLEAWTNPVCTHICTCTLAHLIIYQELILIGTY